MKIIYYFGAGASCEALPVISEIPERLDEFNKFIISDKIKSTDLDDNKFKKTGTSAAEILSELKKDTEWLINKSQRHTTIDTFAKKLYITDDSEIDKLKAIFSCFFLFQQAQYGIDHRYDTFYASLIEKAGASIQLPSNIKIISWNYDSQFEMALSKYLPNYSVDTIREKLNSIPIPGHKINIKEDEFSLIRLNGIAGAFKNEGTIYRASDISLLTKQDFFSSSISKESIEAYQEILLNYAFNKKNDGYSYLQFSWEQNSLTDEIIEKLKSVTSDVDILIVVGYSFPFFNRRIDREILNNMKGLKRIYMQFPESFVNNSIVRIEALLNSKENLDIIPITDIEEFYIPHEYD